MIKKIYDITSLIQLSSVALVLLSLSDNRIFAINGDLGAVKIGFDTIDPIAEGNQYQITKDTERELLEDSDKLIWNTINIWVRFF